MTTLARAPATPTATPRRRRWHRWAIPFAIFTAFWAVTFIAHARQTPDLGDPGTLSPAGTGEFGASQLADRLRAEGVEIGVVTTSQQALTAADRLGRATIFVPAPAFVSPTFASLFRALRGQHRLVLLEPGLFTPFAVAAVQTRWATGIGAPDCSAPVAVAAGRAAVRKVLYEADSTTATMRCYGGGLVGYRQGSAEIIAVGATDPFRNDRIGEVGNATLATGLLDSAGPVIWLDLHEAEPVPAEQLPPLRLPSYHRGEQDRTATGNPTIDAFPRLLWVGLASLAAVALLFAVARARRLGPPVAEPLPVLVPAAEAVTGRGRLYERVGARAATLSTLRAAAIRRLNDILNPFGAASAGRDLMPDPAGTTPPGAGVFVAQISVRTGVAEQRVRTILYGPAPPDDDAMLAAAADLDRLVDAVRHGRAGLPPPATTPGGTP